MIKNISNLGDAAVYCDFGNEVNKTINSKVIKYFKTIKKNNIEGINNLTPSYNKLIISFDLNKTSFKQVKNYIENIEMNNISIMTEKKLPNVLSPSEIGILIDFYDHDLFISSRNKTIIDFMYSTGCRVSELINVEESDIDIEEAFVRLEGKGSKQRIVPLGSKVLINLESYLPLRNKDRKSKNNKLFISKSYKNLDRTAVFRIIKSTGVRAGIHKELYPHILRHSAATHMLEGGCDLRTVQEFLGHSSVSTTQIYTKVTKAFLEEAFIESHPRS